MVLHLKNRDLAKGSIMIELYCKELYDCRDHQLNSRELLI
jgi:hypothetical protein